MRQWMGTESFKGALLSALVIVSLITPLLLLSPSPVHAALTPHAPILINGNAGFTSPDPVNGGGSGTLADPYIIENYIIDASTTHGIEIRNTDNYFVVRNCVVENGWGAYNAGIYLYNVVDGRIENTTCEDSYYGIKLDAAVNNTITNNTLNNNGDDGIELRSSENNTIINNILKNCGIGMSSFVLPDKVTFYNSQVIENNWVNDKPVYYYKNDTGVIVPSDAGEVILANCSNVTIRNVNISNTTVGVNIIYTENSIVENNNFFNSTMGVYTTYSDNITVTNNTFRNNHYGIACSSNHTLKNNTFENNYYGIRLFTPNNTVDNNTCENNYIGIALGGDNNTLTNNTCENNTRGIYLGGWVSHTGVYVPLRNNTLINNTCNNNNAGIKLKYADNNTLANNTCWNNDYGIELENSYNNLIYHNEIINNTNQAYDNGTNYWDNGYPSGGNYWSDYTGKDENHGENQDIPSWSDRIGDTPYDIPGGANKDLYPLVIRGIEVIIEPDNQPGVIGENVVFTVTIKNKGNVWDNYELTSWDNAGWPLELDNDYLEIPMNENRETKLTVSIPDNENLVCTMDNISFSVMIIETESFSMYLVNIVNVHAVSSWSGTATFSLKNLYTVNVEKILDLYTGSKLVVKFYTYGDGYENEKVIETFSPPWYVEENEFVRHPNGIGVKNVRLDLTTGDTSNVIETIASFTVRRVDLEGRFTEIPGEWFLAPPPERTELETEFSRIPSAWFLAPS